MPTPPKSNHRGPSPSSSSYSPSRTLPRC